MWYNVGMMTYVVTTRDAKGERVEEEFSAEDRADLFRQLAACGKRAISIREGTTGKRRAPRMPIAAPRKAHVIAAAAIVVVLAAAAILLLSRKGSEPKRGADGRKRAIPVAAAATNAAHKAEAERTSARTVDEAIQKVPALERPPIKVRELTPEEWDRLTNRTFKTGTEQLMSWVFATEVGDMPMPIPHISEEDRQNIVAILISKNEISENDSERTKECKNAVAAAKKEMIKYLKEGGDPDEFLQYYHQELKRAFEVRNEAINQIQEVWDEDPALGEEFLDKINEKFESEGIKAIRKEQFE